MAERRPDRWVPLVAGTAAIGAVHLLAHIAYAHHPLPTAYRLLTA
ncbi:hypothetical protein GCM10023084_62630 [Streptomyces lacrimifluminis]|uniref:Uncharacterized protein n=1 Tax=Streptomyces lacrimifluminis TaxID=1500077 RepID=A0A917L4M2_9ACTN|nr:hypothetical protein [Streptomyces lacrimifluminis]GGJ42218.1 hypothetical protein GCM10012282_43680 [Streptomyces lacrimifluminis]